MQRGLVMREKWLPTIAFILIMFIPLCSITLPTRAEGKSRYPIDSFEGGFSNGLPDTGDYNCIGVGNVNGDGFLDIVCGAEENYGAQGTTGLYVFTGDGDGNWNQINLTTSNSFAGIEVADCDGDGKMEIYAGYQENGAGIGAWEWNGAGFDQGGITSPLTNGGVNYMRIENMTGDGGLDMAVGTHSGVRYYQGSGGSPVSWTEYSTGLRSSGLCAQIDVADLNNDGLMDIIVGQYGDGLYIFTQDAGGMSWTDRTSSIPSPERTGRVLGLTTGDVNNDGNVDIVLDKRTNPSGLFLLLGNGGGGSGTDFQWTYLNNSWQNRPTGTFYQSHLVDMDMDGDLDLLTAKESSGLHLYLGNGSESPGINFGWTEVVGKGLPTTGMFMGSNYLDFDNDGDLDVAGCTYGSGMTVLRSNLLLPHVPVSRAGADQTVFLGDTVHLDGTNSSDPQDCPGGDVGGNQLIYDWNITVRPGGSILDDADLLPDDTTAKPSFTPDVAGEYALSLVVRDSEDHWAVSEDSVRITVIMVNGRPVAHAGADLEVETGTLVVLNGSGSFDPEDPVNLLTFDWNVSQGNPAPVSLSDEGSAEPSFPAPETTGIYSFTLVIRDSLDAWSREDMVNITIVLPPNQMPVADAGNDFSAFSNESVTLNGSESHDPDGNIVTWDWNCTSHRELPIYDDNTSGPSFTPNRTGSFVFTLTVLDDRGGWAVEDTVNVTIIEENLPPVADAGDDFTAYYGEKTHLNGARSGDPENGSLEWRWSCPSHLGLLLQDDDTATPHFLPDSVDKYIFALVVTDEFGVASTPDLVNVTIIERPVNRRPVANAGRDITNHVNDTVVLNGTRSLDEDGNITLWDWNCTSHPGLLFDRENSSTPSFIPVRTGMYNITLTVRDDLGLWSDEDVVIVTVVPADQDIDGKEKNHPPVVKLTSPRGDAIITNPFLVGWTATDEDLDPLTFNIELLDANGNVHGTLVEGLGPGSYSWNWDTGEIPSGRYRIRITASDGVDSASDDSPEFVIEEKGTDVDNGGDLGASIALALALLIVIAILIISIFLIVRARRKEPGDEDPWDDRADSVEDDRDWRGELDSGRTWSRDGLAPVEYDDVEEIEDHRVEYDNYYETDDVERPDHLGRGFFGDHGHWDHMDDAENDYNHEWDDNHEDELRNEEGGLPEDDVWEDDHMHGGEYSEGRYRNENDFYHKDYDDDIEWS